MAIELTLIPGGKGTVLPVRGRPRSRCNVCHEFEKTRRCPDCGYSFGSGCWEAHRERAHKS